MKKVLRALIIATSSLQAREHDVLLEFKAAYFHPMDHLFRTIYGGGALFGPEITWGLWRKLYGFVSYDYFTKNGTSIGLSHLTNVDFMALGVGIKLMNNVGDHARFYAGLGFQPLYLRTYNCSPYVQKKTKKWGFGGIAKFGVYVALPHEVLLDFFIDYSFVKVKARGAGRARNGGYVQKTKADISGFIFGASVGYEFG